MNKHPYETLTLRNGAKLIFTPCPGSKAATLDESITQLKQAGTSLLLTLMFDDEMSKNQIISLPDVCYENQMRWIQLPIIDDQAPSIAFESQWLTYKSAVLKVISNQGTVAVHCKGGTGRTGLVIALILLENGWLIDEIITEVQKIRPKALINKAQLDYFKAQLRMKS